MDAWSEQSAVHCKATIWRQIQGLYSMWIINTMKILIQDVTSQSGLMTQIFFFILLHHASFNNQLQIHMDVGQSGLNTRWWIDVSLLVKSLGMLTCLTLPGFHTLTGCDYSPSFKGKGKARPLAVLEKIRSTLQFFKIRK